MHVLTGSCLEVKNFYVEKPVKEQEAEARCRVLPWAQEIVFGVSGGKK